MSETLSNDKKIVSDITVFGKYARFDSSKNRRETWGEIVERNKQMHIRKFQELYDNNTEFKETLDSAYEAVLDKAILPSMRSMQFGGLAIETSNSRMFNCAFLPVDSYTAFSETMFLLLGGTGGGFSVQSHNIDQLPPRKESKDKYLHIEIDDSKEGWADAVRECVVAIMEGITVNFDY